jgi:hypothetical protein
MKKITIILLAITSLAVISCKKDQEKTEKTPLEKKKFS